MGPDADENDDRSPRPAASSDGEKDREAETESREDIMRATYRALCEHGFADLTMQDIADEAPVSKAALHYHYDSKRALLVAFQAYISERFVRRVRAADDPDADPRDRLAAVFDAALSPPPDDDLRDLQTALLELKVQAPYEPDIREHVERTDVAFRGLVEAILAEGKAAGVVDPDVDPAATAEFAATVMAGTQARQVAVGQSPAVTRDLLRAHVEAVVTVDGEASDE